MTHIEETRNEKQNLKIEERGNRQKRKEIKTLKSQIGDEIGKLRLRNMENLGLLERNFRKFLGRRRLGTRRRRFRLFRH